MTDVVIGAGIGADSEDPVVTLGTRLKASRVASGMSLRELARQLSVSPSFISQLENGKSQPSVATLYSISQLLGVSIDELFEKADGEAQAEHTEQQAPISRLDLGSPADAWPKEDIAQRLSVVSPAGRSRLVMDSGVIWEQLKRNSDHGVDFMEVIYPAGSSSTNDHRMLRHDGYEYGYLMSGEIEITFGFDTVSIGMGDAMALDSTVPHLFTNRGAVDARGIWFVHHCGTTH